MFEKHLTEECQNIEGRCLTCTKKIKRVEMTEHDCAPELLITVNTLRKQNEELLIKSQLKDKTSYDLSDKTKMLETLLD